MVRIQHLVLNLVIPDRVGRGPITRAGIQREKWCSRNFLEPSAHLALDPGSAFRLRLHLSGPDSDIGSLREMGVDGVFPAGTMIKAIEQYIRENRPVHS